MKIEIWSLIHIWHLFCFQKCSLPLKHRFFLSPLEKSKNFKNSKIFNYIGSHDGLKKKLPKSAKIPLITLFFYSPCIYNRLYEQKCTEDFTRGICIYYCVFNASTINNLKKKTYKEEIILSVRFFFLIPYYKVIF